MTVKIEDVRKGAKVKLRGDAVLQPRKPYPLGWHEVLEVDLAGAVRVVGDDRWIPARLVEDVR